MEDEVYWEAFRELEYELNREPEYEEVQEYLRVKFHATKEEKIKYFQDLYIKGFCGK